MKEKDALDLILLKNHIRKKIEENGPITFDAFMDEALYHKDWGYYEKCELNQVGKTGDFMTSVSVGEAFGKLLALKLISLAKKTPHQNKPIIVEAGAHDAQLADDILNAVETLGSSDSFRKYAIIEPSNSRRAYQMRKLNKTPIDVEWLTTIEELPDNIPIIFLSNELFDAMPFRRIYWNKNSLSWMEWLVTFSEDNFSWIPAETTVNNQSMVLQARLDVEKELARHIPDHFTIEVSPNSVDYYQKLLNRINSGFVITIDYGQTGEQWLQPHKVKGTLRGYQNHKLVDNELAHPGSCDLTCDVCFQDLELTGKQAGFGTEFCGTQQSYLTHILRENQSLINHNQTFWGQKDNRQFLTLVSPQFFGARFKVLEQSLFV